MENWNHPVTHVKIIEGYEDSSHPIQAHTDGSKNDLRVRTRTAIFLDTNLTATLKYRLNGRCTNNQAEQMAILKALEYIKYTELGEKSVLVHTHSQITLQLLQNQKKHTRLIEQIGTEVIEMEQHEWTVEFSWIKAHRDTEEMKWPTNWRKKQQITRTSWSTILKYQRGRCCVNQKNKVFSSGKMNGKDPQKG